MIVPVDNVVPGMILAEAVLDRYGRTILPRGTEVEEKHIRGLKTLGVSFIKIRDEKKVAKNLPDSIKTKIEQSSSQPINNTSQGMKAAKLKIPGSLHAPVIKGEALVQLRFRHTNLEHPVMKQLYDYCLSKELKQKAEK